MKSKIIALLLAAVMCLSLCACNKDEGGEPLGGNPDGSNQVVTKNLPTAEELVAGGSLGDVASLDADVAMHFSAQMSAEELGSGLGDPNLTMTMGIDVSVNVQNEGDVNYMNGTIGVDMLGFSYSEPMEQYVVTNADGSMTTYQKDSATETWTYSTSTAPATDVSSGLSSLTDLDSNIINDLTLQPVMDGDSVYVVSGKISVRDLSEQTGMSADELFSSFGGTEIPEDMTFNLYISYDIESKQLVSMMLDLEPGSGEMDGVTVEAFNMSISINSVNTVHVSVPDDVLANAMEEMNWDIDSTTGSTKTQTITVATPDSSSLDAFDASEVYGSTVQNCAVKPGSIDDYPLNVFVHTEIDTGFVEYTELAPYQGFSDTSRINQNGMFSARLVIDHNEKPVGILFFQGNEPSSNCLGDLDIVAANASDSASGVWNDWYIKN